MKESKIKYDLHVHSIASDGLHTMLKIVEIVQQKGLKGVNISDHGKALDSSFKTSRNFVLEERMPSDHPYFNGIRLLKGIEANLLPDGTYDLLWYPSSIIPELHLITVGLHSKNNCFPVNKGKTYNTERLMQCISNYPVDIIAHPCTKKFPINIPSIIKICVEKGIALEINNCNLRLGKTDLDQLRLMLDLAKKKGCRVVGNSDGHTWYEIGCFEKIEEFIDEINFPLELILNSSEEKTLAFIKERKALRQKK